MSRIRTCLWFEKGGEDAARFYCDLIPNSEIESVMKPDPDGEALLVNFKLDGVPYLIINGGVQFPQNGSASIVVSTKTQEDTDHIWGALLGETGEEHMCGWLRDQFGMEWQVVPEPLMKALSSSDRDAAGRAQAAMLEMRKIDIARIHAAFAGEKLEGDNG